MAILTTSRRCEDTKRKAASGQIELFVRLEHGEAAHFAQVEVQRVLAGRQGRQVLLRRCGQGIAFGQDVGVGVERGHVVFGQIVADVFAVLVLGVGNVHGFCGFVGGGFSGGLFGKDLRFDDFGFHNGMMLFSRRCGRNRGRDRVVGGPAGRLAALGGLGGNATAHMICTSFCHKSVYQS